MSRVLETFRKNLAASMEANGISQGQLAGIAKMQQPQISALLAGRNIPKLNTAEKLANALGFEVWELLKEDPPKPENLTSIQREIIARVRSMNDKELGFFLTMFREWARGTSEAHNKNKKAR